MQQLPNHFAGDDDLIASHLAAVLCALFPDGEDFFVRSVRNYRDRIEDPLSDATSPASSARKAVNGREHRVLNDRLAELGYPTKRIERSVRFGLRIRDRFASPMANLAAAAALEHCTATLAEMLLRDYNRSDFHPDDLDTDELLARWREELFGVDGRLNHMLAGAA